MLAAFSAVRLFLGSPLGKRLMILAAVGAAMGLIWRAGWDARDKKAIKQVAAVHAELVTCQGNTETLKAALARQNGAVDALKAEGDARLAQSRKAAGDARAVAESYRRAGAAVLAEKPKAGADRCAAADQLIREHAER